jgi:hypothetical protein
MVHFSLLNHGHDTLRKGTQTNLGSQGDRSFDAAEREHGGRNSPRAVMPMGSVTVGISVQSRGIGLYSECTRSFDD